MRYTYLVFLPVLLLFSCGREFLDIRRDANQVVPGSIGDYQAILDNNGVMNKTSLGLAMIGADEFSVSDEVLRSLSASNTWQRNAYLWLLDIFAGDESNDWNNPYERILYANLAMDIQKIKPIPTNQSDWDVVMGQALFHRAWNYFQLAQTFCDHYEKSGEKGQLGLPLRLDYDVTTTVTRHSLQETYERILTDLEEAIILLPDVSHHFQPSKASGYALLARIKLYAGEYAEAEHAAGMALQYRSELIDFNTLDWNQRYTFSAFTHGYNNPEVIFYTYNTASRIMANSRMNVDSTLYRSYDDDDLRKVVYFGVEADGRVQFKGSYQGGGAYFTGLATDELYLIKAECAVRRGDLSVGQTYLNMLLEKRYQTGTFVDMDFSDMDEQEALATVLNERHKELYMRGMRWGDLKRLNTDERFATSLEREFEGRLYELKPNAINWAYPLPDNEIDLSGLDQNPRQ